MWIKLCAQCQRCLNNEAQKSLILIYHVSWFILRSYPIPLVTKRFKFICGKSISKRHTRLTIYFQLDSTSLTASISLRVNVRTRVATGKGNEQYFFTVKDNLKVRHFNSSTFRKECTRQIIILTSKYNIIALWLSNRLKSYGISLAKAQ